jgi:hypothetical protein
VFPLMAIGAGMNLLGGIIQSGQIRRQTQERLRQMRMQSDQELGRATAVAGASGVEMGSASVQLHLARMGEEWAKRMGAVSEAGDSAAGLSMLQGAASAFGGLSKAAGLSATDLQLSSDAWNGSVLKTLPETNPGIRTPEFDWIGK